ncbi:c-type cytochrome [Methylocystis sp.]|uniref:c-type cytochrome n=1 Tax=Methylocystis sp. TaxID=1911079 RepID=UPI003DA632CF
MVRFAAASALAALLALAAFSAASIAHAAGADALKFGESIARANCARCHAVGVAGKSPNPKSPPFRYLSRKYPLSSLEEALGEGILVGHEGPEMPQFQFDTGQIEALLAYLGSIQKK